jgi:hypothetical protein
MKPSDFPRFERGDNKRFHVRQWGKEWQVYGTALIHVAMCDSGAMANMVADALEAAAEHVSDTEGKETQ